MNHRQHHVAPQEIRARRHDRAKLFIVGPRFEGAKWLPNRVSGCTVVRRSGCPIARRSASCLRPRLPVRILGICLRTRFPVRFLGLFPPIHQSLHLELQFLDVAVFVARLRLLALRDRRLENILMHPRLSHVQCEVNRVIGIEVGVIRLVGQGFDRCRGVKIRHSHARGSRRGPIVFLQHQINFADMR